jgi:hypothetical protein
MTMHYVQQKRNCGLFKVQPKRQRINKAPGLAERVQIPRP